MLGLFIKKCRQIRGNLWFKLLTMQDICTGDPDSILLDSRGKTTGVLTQASGSHRGYGLPNLSGLRFQEN